MSLDKSKTVRGGLLTHASIHAITSNGSTTSPVIRGTWMLEKFLAPPRPRLHQIVPAIEPDIRGATTIKEQLAKHRDIASCASCHRKIDPLGFALENFDVIGGWRDHYRRSLRLDRVLAPSSAMVHRSLPPMNGPAWGDSPASRSSANW